MRSASSAEGMPASAGACAPASPLRRDDKPGTGVLPRLICRPPPPISSWVSASSRAIESRMSAMRLRNG